jgi:hypothetical protein
MSLSPRPVVSQRRQKEAIKKHAEDFFRAISFRVSLSALPDPEGSINQILSIFEKPLKTLGMDKDLASDFSGILKQIQQKFAQAIESSMSDEKEGELWTSWHEFDVILHRVSDHPVLFYAQIRFKSIIHCIDNWISQMAAATPPCNPHRDQHFQVAAKVTGQFKCITERIAEIFAAAVSDCEKTSQLEALRNQIRHFRTDLAGVHNTFFTASKASRLRQEETKEEIQNGLTELINAISDIRRQSYVLETMDLQIEQSMRSIKLLIAGKRLLNAKGVRPSRPPDENVIATNCAHQREKRVRISSSITHRRAVEVKNDPDSVPDKKPEPAIEDQAVVVAVRDVPVMLITNEPIITDLTVDVGGCPLELGVELPALIESLDALITHPAPA